MSIYVRDGGVWKPATAYVKDAGVWKLTNAYVKDAGTWKLASASLDTTPPAKPTISLTTVNNRYLSVGISVGSSNVADLKMVRVLVTDAVTPTSQFSTVGYVSLADADYPGEPWSDWTYNTTGRVNSAATTYKEYPPNPTSSTQLAGGKYYYVSAWSVDNSGNWSAMSQKSVYLTPLTTDPGTQTPSDTDTRKTYTDTWTATWSRSWKGDNSIYSTGGTLKTGAWPDMKGQMRSIVSFPSVKIQNALVGAEIKKVEVRLRTRNNYYDYGRVRWQYHNNNGQPSDPADVNHFGVWNEETGWADETTKWINITSDTPSQWKDGGKNGLWFAATDSDLHYATSLAGHDTASPPAIRITYLK